MMTNYAAICTARGATKATWACAKLHIQELIPAICSYEQSSL